MKRRSAICVGLVGPSFVARVSQYPGGNGHALYRDYGWALATDAAIVAATLGRWGTRARLIGNGLGKDALGREYIRWVRSFGVAVDIALRRDFVTPVEVILVDGSGARTWYSQENPALWGTVSDASLNALRDADFVYTDWYAGEGAQKTIRVAAGGGVPVFLNLGSSGARANLPQWMWRACAFFQAHVQDGEGLSGALEALEAITRKVQGRPVILTRGRRGCVAEIKGIRYQIRGQKTRVVDTNGAGATFSAGFMRSILLGSTPVQALSFASAAATLKCTAFGITACSHREIEEYARSFPAQRVMPLRRRKPVGRGVGVALSRRL